MKKIIPERVIRSCSECDECIMGIQGKNNWCKFHRGPAPTIGFRIDCPLEDAKEEGKA